MNQLEKAIREAQGKPSQSWNYEQIATLQSLIDSGEVWHLEGAAGRTAMRALESGACFLPLQRSSDHWGNVVPARSDLKPGTKGTLENSARFYNLN